MEPHVDWSLKRSVAANLKRIAEELENEEARDAARRRIVGDPSAAESSNREPTAAAPAAPADTGASSSATAPEMVDSTVMVLTREGCSAVRAWRVRDVGVGGNSKQLQLLLANGTVHVFMSKKKVT